MNARPVTTAPDQAGDLAHELCHELLVAQRWRRRARVAVVATAAFVALTFVIPPPGTVAFIVGLITAGAGVTTIGATGAWRYHQGRRDGLTYAMRGRSYHYPPLAARKMAYHVPMSPGTCEGCSHRIAYNLAAGITVHIDPHPADCTCGEPYPNTQ